MDAVDERANAYWETLPEDYTPEYEFGSAGGQTWAFPARRWAKERWNRNAVFSIPEGYDDTVTEQMLGTGGVEGAEVIDPENPPEKYRRDFDIWRKLGSINQERDDSFKGLVANLFGNSFTIPAAFAAGVMGTNLIGGLAAGAGAGGAEAAGGAGAYTAGDLGGAVGSGASSVYDLANAATPIVAGGGGSAAAGAGGAGAAGAGAAGAGAVGALGGAMDFLGSYGPIIGAGINAAGSLAGGALAAKGAKNAAQTQADAAAEANRLLQYFYEQSREDLRPYREAGYQALGQTQDLVSTPLGFDPYSGTPTLDPSQYAFDPNQYAFNTDQYAFTAPNQPLDPAAYKFAPTSGQQVLNDDPGYQFRIAEGMKALHGTQAARGGLLSGGAIKGALKYGQGLASQEYGAAYNRALGRNQMDWERAQYGNEQTYNRALNENQMGYERGLQGNQMGYERALQGNELGYGRAYQQNADEAARARDVYATNYQTQMGSRQQRFNELASLTGLGQTSTAQGNALGSALGQQLSGNITSAGAAKAAGQVGAANAYGQALGGVGNAANSYLNYQLLLQMLNQRR